MLRPRCLNRHLRHWHQGSHIVYYEEFSFLTFSNGTPQGREIYLWSFKDTLCLPSPFLVFLLPKLPCLFSAAYVNFTQPLNTHPTSFSFHEVLPNFSILHFSLLLNHIKSSGHSGTPNILSCASSTRRH